MKRHAFTILMGALALASFTSPLSAAQLTDQNKQFLAAYDKVHHALVADDLAAATKAAGDLGPSGSDLAKSKTLDEALGSDSEYAAAHGFHADFTDARLARDCFPPGWQQRLVPVAGFDAVFALSTSEFHGARQHVPRIG